jgi:hypothetical protein
MFMAAAMFLWMCDPAVPPAEHGGVVVSVGSQPLEVVAHADGHVVAYPIAESTVRGPDATIVVHVPGADGAVHDAPMTWDEPSGMYVGVVSAVPRAGPLEIDAVIAGAPVHVSSPVLVVVQTPAPPAALVVVGSAPRTVVAVDAPPPPGHAHVEVVAPHPPGVVVVEPPRPGVVVVEPPRPPGAVVVVEPPRPPGVVLLAPPPPGPPGVVLVGPQPPRPGVVIVGGDRDGRVDEGRGGHWDHGRHGGGGPEWHGGGGGGGHGHGH